MLCLKNKSLWPIAIRISGERLACLMQDLARQKREKDRYGCLNKHFLVENVSFLANLTFF